ncbi:MAG: histidinol-phosphate transaminase [Actinomycetota bacterium]
MSIGNVRPAVAAMPVYRPGKAAEQAEEEHGISDAIKLASNENPYPPVPSVVEAIAEAATSVNRYCDHLAVDLRTSIGELVNLDLDHVAVGCGSVGLLQQLCLAYLDPGDQVVYPWRSFEAYPVNVMMMGAESKQVALVDHAFDLDQVAAGVGDRTKMIMLATPNNPTGTAVTVDAMRSMLAKVPDDVIVLIDEAYREFLDPGFGDPVQLLADHPNVVVSRTFSKAYGLAGVRVGYLVARPDVIDQVNKVLAPFAVNGLAQAAASAALAARDEYEPLLQGIRDERTRVVAALTDAGWELPDAQANFVYLPTGERTTDLYVEIEKRGVVTRPFAGEGIRVTIGTPEENDRFLATLAEVSD